MAYQENVETSQEISAYITPHNSAHTLSLSQDQRLVDNFSGSDVFNLLVEEIYGLINKANQLEREFSQIQDTSRLSYSNESSTRKNEDHTDILLKKSLYTDKLTASVLLSNKPTGIPVYRIQCYEGLSALVNKRYEETKQEVHQRKEEIKKMKTESTRAKSQIATFSNLLEIENEENDLRRINKQFQKAKTDLGIVLSVLFSDKVKEEFTLLLGPLTEALVNNLESKEDQYVEIPDSALKLKPMRCLYDDKILVRHPSKPRMYCLCIED